MVFPTSVRVETCTLCQLKCPHCPTPAASGFLGKGKLSLDNFRKLLDANPQIQKVELGSKGEALLNDDLPGMLRYAHEKGVITSLNQGTNLNHASDEMLDAVVRYGMSLVRVSIDGVTQDIYERYRIGGNLATVIRNVEKINRLKKRYSMETPKLIFQFIVFAHNIHQMRQAAALAKILNMKILFKLNMYPEPLTAEEEARIREVLGYATREEFMEQHGRYYVRDLCYQMWNYSQINWDGRLLGCCRNLESAYVDNVFETGLVDAVNCERMESARRTLTGSAPPAPDLPCVGCDLYKAMAEGNNWIRESEISAWESSQFPVVSEDEEGAAGSRRRHPGNTGAFV